MVNPCSFHGLNSQSHAVDFLYYSLTTITTTGYGDIYPLTKTAKVITSIEIVLGASARYFMKWWGKGSREGIKMEFLAL
ncbi:hypothetical protein P378_03130 [Desulforamulus profundi]|uniref:Potassium channel domain-containing protein n=1 Tax=Desulforamulus profundi TaxID=1383067 RepID=A0A2C6MI05_9FIRM|nr:hypothetical protein P378_03130 [Desulforamulus profundi]